LTNGTRSSGLRNKGGKIVFRELKSSLPRIDGRPTDLKSINSSQNPMLLKEREHFQSLLGNGRMIQSIKVMEEFHETTITFNPFSHKVRSDWTRSLNIVSNHAFQDYPECIVTFSGAKPLFPLQKFFQVGWEERQKLILKINSKKKSIVIRDWKS